MKSKVFKQAYIIPCSSNFRDKITKLAEEKSVNVADIARSILLVISRDVIRTFTDPGEPSPEDRERILLKSGPSKGRPWHRKPRLQVRLSAGYRITDVRRALNLALILDDGQHEVSVSGPFLESDKNSTEIAHEAERLQIIVLGLLFTPLMGGVSSRAEALYILGFAPSLRPDRRAIRSRYRALASIYHPDSIYGNNERMSQLNAAMDLLIL
jgi:hypothetical protein